MSYAYIIPDDTQCIEDAIITMITRKHINDVEDNCYATKM